MTCDGEQQYEEPTAHSRLYSLPVNVEVFSAIATILGLVDKLHPWPRANKSCKLKKHLLQGQVF